jgi:hypothetical protein
VSSGNSYELTVWGALTRSYDVAFVGVAFRDSSGKRLTELEPPMIEFTSTRYSQLGIQFTVDKRVARANVFVWKLEGGAGFFVDDFKVRTISGIDEDESQASKPVSCQALLVPGYFDPVQTGYWQETTSTGSGVRFVIINPDSGPSNRYDRTWGTVVSDSFASGFRVLAYVKTGWGARSAEAVIAEMDKYRDWYGVTDFFVDEAATRYEYVDHYRAIVDNIHRNGGMAVLNFGWSPHPAYMEFTDVASVFEDTYSVYANGYDRPSWYAAYPANRFLHIVHSTPATRWQNVITLSRERNAGYVWVTDDDTESYYKSLPSFWTKLNQSVRAGC